MVIDWRKPERPHSCVTVIPSPLWPVGDWQFALSKATTPYVTLVDQDDRCWSGRGAGRTRTESRSPTRSARTGPAHRPYPRGDRRSDRSGPRGDALRRAALFYVGNAVLTALRRIRWTLLASLAAMIIVLALSASSSECVRGLFAVDPGATGRQFRPSFIRPIFFISAKDAS